MPRVGHSAVQSVPVYVYALLDPRDGALRYVGRSSNPAKRVRNHLNPRQSGPRMTEWIQGLAAAGLMPDIAVLREVPEAA